MEEVWETLLITILATPNLVTPIREGGLGVVQDGRWKMTSGSEDLPATVQQGMIGKYLNNPKNGETQTQNTQTY